MSADAKHVDVFDMPRESKRLNKEQQLIDCVISLKHALEDTARILSIATLQRCWCEQAIYQRHGGCGKSARCKAAHLALDEYKKLVVTSALPVTS